MKWLLLAWVVLALTGCTRFIFHPVDAWVQNPANQELAYQDVVLIEADGTRIDGWWLPASAPLKGTVYFLHGNAYNISYVLNNVKWLPAKGYQVLMIDYQGYGLSDGSPSLAGSMVDIATGLDWLVQSGRLQQQPLIVYGQSLGASMGIWALAQEDNQGKADCLIEEAGFADYHEIANAVMKKSWLLWPLRPLVIPLINNDYAPVNVVDKLAPMPVLFIHSQDDELVPFAQGKQLYNAAKEPKTFLAISGEHARGITFKSVRQKMLGFMAKCGDSAAALPSSKKPVAEWQF